MPNAMVVEWVKDKYEGLKGSLNERSRRLWAATEARSLGRGGVAAVIAATGMSSATVSKGLRELEAKVAGGATLPPGRIRRPGGGRKRARDKQPGLSAALAALVEPTARGDPEHSLRWTCKSTAKLAAELQKQGFQVSPRTVAKELKEPEFSLQSNRKTREGQSHPDRDAQFAHINEQVVAFQRRGQPAISVDTKKKELVGDFKNAGREWRRRGHPEKVRVHDFPDPKKNKAIPYGVYDLTHNEGWVSVGIDHDTARFAAASIKRWWRKMGRKRYPQAKELLITADCGGSNSSRTASVESGAARTGRRIGVAADGLPLSSGHEQVEQDRAPNVLPHHAELARPAADELRGDRSVDWEYPDDGWTEDTRRVGRACVCAQGDRDGQTTRRSSIDAGDVPWRVELYSCSTQISI